MVAGELRAEPSAAGIGPTTGDEGSGAAAAGGAAVGMGVWQALSKAATALDATANSQNLRGSVLKFFCLISVQLLQFLDSIFPVYSHFAEYLL